MKRLIMAAGLLAAAAWAQAPPAQAADLDYTAPYKSGSPYDDPRYGDIYRHPEQRRYAAPYQEDRRYEDRRYEDRRYLPPMRSDRDDCADCDPPPPYRRYSDAEPRHDGRGPHCLPKAEIKHGLLREGWRDFHDPELREQVAWLNARRPSGRLFRIKIDRCTGEILKAQAIDGPTPAPWAHQQRRFDRHYWN